MKFMGSIAKAFTLSLCIIANTHLAYAQTASILPPAKTTFFDSNGNPLTAGKVDFYIPGTTTRKTTWQDAAETIPNANPVTLDAAGRALVLGSGSYRQVVKDKLGNLIWDQVTSSTGSGGGGGTTATGDGDLVGTIKPWAGMTAPNQYAFTYGQEVSRATFATLFTAITSAQAAFCTSASPILTGLSDTTNFWIGSTVEISCIAGGFSTIISKTATTVTLAANANVTTNTTATFLPWGRGNGSTTFNLPDFRGVPIAGNNNMGGTASSNLTAAYFGATDPNSIGALGGSQSASITLLTANLPPYTPSGTIVNGGISTSTNAIQNVQGSGAGNWGSGSFQTGVPAVVNVSQLPSGFTGVAQGGTSTPIVKSLIQPTKTSNYIIKTTPDTNSATASGVTSLGSMTGDIACGAGLLCTGNNISIGGSVASISSDAISYTAAGTGAVAQTQTARNAITVSVKDYGALGNGSDDTIAVNRAVTYACSLPTAANVYFPHGYYLLTSTINVGCNGVYISGESRENTQIRRNHDTGYTISFTNGTTTYQSGNGVTDLSFLNMGTMTPANSPFHLNFDYVQRVEVRNVVMHSGTGGIRFAGCISVWMDNFFLGFSDANGPTGRTGVAISGTNTVGAPGPWGGNYYISNSDVWGGYIDGGGAIVSTLDYGWRITAGDGIWLTNIHSFNTTLANYSISNFTAGWQITNIFAANVMSDHAKGFGLLVDGSQTTGVVEWQGRFSTLGNNDAGFSGIGISGGLNQARFAVTVEGYKGNGIYIGSPAANNISIFPGSITNNDASNVGGFGGIWLAQCVRCSVTGGTIGGDAKQDFGIRIGALSNQITVSGTTIADNQGPGILVDNGADNFTLSGITNTGNSASLTDNSTTVNKVIKGVQGANDYPVLPVVSGGTGITSFGTGVAAWLSAPSSSNLASAVTGETGTGALVFGTSPAITTPTLTNPILTVTTVAALPTCAAGTKSMRSFVTDNNTALAFAAVITSGGAIQTPVYCDGTVWRQG